MILQSIPLIFCLISTQVNAYFNKVHIHVHDTPRFQIGRAPIACLGEPVQVECTFDGRSLVEARQSGFVIYRRKVTGPADFERLDNSSDQAVQVFSTDLYNSGDTEYFNCLTKAETERVPIPLSHRLNVILSFQNCSIDRLRYYKKKSGGNTTLHCVQAQNGDRIQWQIDGFVQEEYTNSYSIVLRNLTSADRGIYGCFASNNRSSTIYTATFDLNVIEPRRAPNFRVISVTDTEAKVIWDPKYATFNRWGVRRWIQVDRNPQIVLTQVDRFDRFTGFVFPVNDSQEYLLTDLHPMTLYLVHLRSESKWMISDELPFITTQRNKTQENQIDLRVNLGDRLVLDCGTDLENVAIVRKVIWTRKPNSISSRESEIRQGIDLRYQKFVTFRIDSVLAMDLGTYECRVIFNEKNQENMALDWPESAKESKILKDYVTRIVLSLKDTSSGKGRLPVPRNLQCTNVTEKSSVMHWESDWSHQGNCSHKIRYWLRRAHFEDSGQIVVKWPKMDATIRNLRAETVYGIQIVSFDEDGESEAANINCLTESVHDEEK